MPIAIGPKEKAYSLDMNQSDPGQYSRGTHLGDDLRDVYKRYGGEWPTGSLILGADNIEPVRVEGDTLEVDSEALEPDRVYTFKYVGAKMVLWKMADGTIDIYQVIDR